MGLAGMEPGYQVRVVPVRYVNVQELQKAIEPLMPPKSVVRADEARNMLMLAGSAAELESVMDTIQLFDVDYMRGMSVGIFPVKNVDVPTIAEEVGKLMGTGSKGGLSSMLKIIPVERLNAVMAVSPQSTYLDDVETWIERLDRYSSNKSSNLHVYQVQNVDAADLANTLGQIFGQSGGKGGSRGASVAPGMSGSSVSGGSSSGDTNNASPGTGSSNTDEMSSGGTGSNFYVDSAFAFGDTTSSGTTGGLGSSSSGMGGSSGFGSSSSGMGGSGGFGSSSGSGRRGSSRGATATDLGNNTRIIADPNNNALIIMAKPQAYKEIEAVIKELDVLPLQVLIDATIVEVTLSDDLTYGLKWYFEHGKGAAVLDSPTSALISSAAGGFTYSLVNHAKDIRVELDALANKSKVNVLSTPSVMVLNNQEAQINVGRRVPTPTTSVSNFSTTTATVLPGTNTDGTLSANLQYQESGVTLRVRPRVNSGGLVIMDIAQQSSDPKSVKVGGVDTYEFQQRKINSVVAVPNGETLALGGLIQDTRTDPSISGLPILSQIPFIGPLFGTWKFAETKTELVMLITPRIVENRPDITRVTNEFRRRMKSFNLPEPVTVETLSPASTISPTKPWKPLPQ
jgi:general secretion pathway protein D